MTDPEKQADELAERSKKLGEQIAETQEDWEAKRRDAGVPGAQPLEPGEEPEDGDAREPWPDE
jgi:hypothetical protein